MQELHLRPKNIRDSKGRFAKGIIPFNKGTKGLKGANKTSFKKGQKPFNTKFDGAISLRTDGYQYVRVKKAKWVLLHRYIWQQIHGTIPDKHVITFKDKNPMNCTIDNLECISMAENRNRNINYKKSASSLRNTWKNEKLRDAYGLKLETKLINRKNKR